MRNLTATQESWPIAGRFTISRTSKTEAEVVLVQLGEGEARGRGECTPYDRYGQTPTSVLEQVEAVRPQVEAGCDRAKLQSLLPAGSARCALDCALWDLEAKLSGVPVWRAAGLGRLDPVKTVYTLSLGSPEEMADAARKAARRPMLKLKIGRADDLDRVQAVREAAPLARLIVDANEAFTIDDLKRLAPEFARLDVKLIEQPLPADADEELEGFESPVPLCADESLHSRADLAACARRYQAINIKLDKTGGLTEALALKAEAQALGLEVMVGCMLATSLSMAPGMIVAQGLRFVDLDGPLLLARDREPGLTYVESMIEPPPPELWG